MLTDAFGNAQVGGYFFDWRYLNETSDAGVVQTQVLTGNRTYPTVDVIGSSIWARFDFGHLAFAYDRTRVSSEARDMVLRTLAFATPPSVLGHWVAEGTDFFFNPDGSVEMQLGSSLSTSYASNGRYSIVNDRMRLSYTLLGVPITKDCGYSVTLSHLRSDCGSGAVCDLRTMPDLIW